MDRWLEAGLLDAATAERIRAFEAAGAEQQKLRWPIVLAVAFGGLLVGAGVLLFVSAHWDSLSPAARFSLVLLLVAVFHAAGTALAERFEVLATVFHAVGTATLGAGIFLTGQIFNLQEHWPGGLMLWAAGAWAGWLLVRNWPQAAFAALLTPAWLIGEWSVATEGVPSSGRIPAQGVLLLALTYLAARTAEHSGAVRRTLGVIGAVALFPAVIAVIATEPIYGTAHRQLSSGLTVVGWTAAFILPLLLALWLRGRGAWVNTVAAVWVLVLGALARHVYAVGGVATQEQWRIVAWHAWCALGSIGLISWGLYEGRRDAINLGVAGFALTVLSFYFANVMDKLGRAAGLVGLGVLFLLGGWALEKARRRLVARVSGG